MIWPLKKPEPEVVASVDLGSNSFHMIVCRIQDGQLVIVDRLREMVRLAAGIDKTKNITAEVQARALECLTRFGERIRDLPDYCVRIVGTNTLRSARNSAEFIQQAQERLGHRIDIISGVEEARLIYLGVAHSLAADQSRRLVMDIGGGSTELIIGEGFEARSLDSLHMGCVSMTRRFFEDGSITAKAIKKAEIAAQQELENIANVYKSGNWHEAIGASGTIRAVDKIVHAQGWAENGITYDSLEKLIAEMQQAGHIDMLKLEGLDPERAPVFPGGVMILYATFKALGIECMRVADGALREGLIHDLLGRIHHEDVRSRSVTALAQRYHVDMELVSRILDTIRYCFKQAADKWQLEDEDLQWLEWAGSLHEIGLDISHSQFQKHSAYIIQHTDLAGFSRQEQQLLAMLTLSHRRKFPKKEFGQLPVYWRKKSMRLAILLRLATLFHRSRSRTPLPEFRLTVKNKKLSLTFPSAWLTDHQLTFADLEEEASFLKAAGFELTFC